MAERRDSPHPVVPLYRLFPSAVMAVAVLAICGVPRASSSPPLPFDPPSRETLMRAERKVYAHYFTQFPVTIDNEETARDNYARHYLNPHGEDGKFLEHGGFLRQRPLPRPPRETDDWALSDLREEVRRAKAIGLDGFAVNLLNDEGYHRERAERLLEAARLEGGFDIMLMPDMNAALGDEPQALVEMIAALSGHAGALRLDDGRLVVAPYLAQRRPPAWWRSRLADLAALGIDVALVPVFHDWRNHYRAYAPLSHGVSDWGDRRATTAGRWSDMARLARAAGLLWMAPVTPQDVRPKSGVYWEARGSALFREQWKAAIDGGADWVHLISWNDYSEHTTIAPGTATGYAFYDLTAYYVTWFKTGRRPRIARDAIYAFHRLHAAAAEPRQQASPLQPASSSDPPRDEVEMLAFLTAPATLEVVLGGERHRRLAGAGVTSFRIPLSPGVPVFRILRDGATISEMRGGVISAEIDVQDLLYHARGSLRDMGCDPAPRQVSGTTGDPCSTGTREGL